MPGLKRAIERINAYKEWSHSLSLANLGLTSEDVEQLLPRLLKLKKLYKLDLSNNTITNLPDGIADLKELTSLNLANNSITTIPNSLRRLCSIKTNHFRSLNLFNNNLKRTPWGLFRHMLFGELIIDDINNTFSISSIKKRCFNFGVHMTLMVMSNMSKIAGYINFNTEMGSFLTNTSNKLKTYLEKEEYSSIAKRVSSYETQYGNLDLSNTCLTNEKLAELIPIIADILELKRLKISNNNLTVLPDDIGSINTITHLNLSNNDLTKLPFSIHKLKNLLELNLSNNDRIIIPYCLEEYLPNLRVLILDESISLRNLLKLLQMKKLDPKKISSDENLILVYGLSKKLINEYGKFHESLREDFMKIAEIVLDKHPNMKTDKFFMFFDSLSTNQKKGIVNKLISISELKIESSKLDGLTVPFTHITTPKTPNPKYSFSKMKKSASDTCLNRTVNIV